MYSEVNEIHGSFSVGIRQEAGREADHSPPTSVEVKECVELYLHSPNTPSWRGVQLKHRDNFTLHVKKKCRLEHLLTGKDLAGLQVRGKVQKTVGEEGGERRIMAVNFGSLASANP
jgi:hypothetical protein